ncbi:TetR/AcrR family transcriptional regulator [Candidatus Izimaplasma bacterium]|nr:TetR/AcrR family transcriptional regulator [Candidatus Izimaplasma bacterium]
MPKKTYFNLDEDKRKRIFNAGVLEFSYHQLNDASVNTIIKIANISKGSFYQYFTDKNEFYWYIVTEILTENVGKYENLLKRHEGDLFKAEEQLFISILDIMDDQKYRTLIRNVYTVSFFELRKRLSNRASTVYIDTYDLLMRYGFKGYSIKSKDDFITVFNMVRNIANNAIMTMISDGMSKSGAKDLYGKEMEVLRKGILKRRFTR